MARCPSDRGVRQSAGVPPKPEHKAEPGKQDVTRLLQALGDGNQDAASELLPLVYGELRKPAKARMAKEAPGQTLQPTALVHEAYMRLVGEADVPRWNGRGHLDRKSTRLNSSH